MTRKFLTIAALAASFVFSTISEGCKKSTNSTVSGCVSNPTTVPTATEMADLQAYITANNITATQDPQGFFYNIFNAGTGVNPSASSTVTVKYIGSLTNGNVFDANQTGATFVLSQLILGWQKGLPLIKKGGTIKLYLPPTLGYGCNSAGTIPPGSILIFTIDLINVQ